MHRAPLCCLLFAVSAWAAICPMEEHQVCNPDHDDHACVCQISRTEENPAPERSCNRVARPAEDGKFPAVSVKFELDDSDKDMEEWPQEKFVESIAAKSLRIQKDSLIILRVSCQGTEDELTVQFAVLKKNLNETTPYEEDDFVDPEGIANKLKAFGHLHKIADLNVKKIEYVEELITIEFDSDNTYLIAQAILVAIGFVFMLILGCVKACTKKDEYEDDLQKP